MGSFTSQSKPRCILSMLAKMAYSVLINLLSNVFCTVPKFERLNSQLSVTYVLSVRQLTRLKFSLLVISLENEKGLPQSYKIRIKLTSLTDCKMIGGLFI